jgi:hypothetical protein
MGATCTLQVGFVTFVQPLNAGIWQRSAGELQLVAPAVFPHRAGDDSLQQNCPAPHAPVESLGPAPPQIESATLSVDPQIRVA